MVFLAKIVGIDDAEFLLVEIVSSDLHAVAAVIAQAGLNDPRSESSSGWWNGEKLSD